jgi:hypothetical protein
MRHPPNQLTRVTEDLEGHMSTEAWFFWGALFAADLAALYYIMAMLPLV